MTDLAQLGQWPLTSRSEPRSGFRQVGREASSCRARSAAIVADGKTGWLVAPYDARALAEALVAAASDADERRARGERAYAESRRYGWPAIVPRFAAFYEELLAWLPARQLARRQRG